MGVADNLERALDTGAAAPRVAAAAAAAVNPGTAAVDGIVEGVRMTQQGLHECFIKHGVERVYPVGEAFNPDLHEAVRVVGEEEARAMAETSGAAEWKSGVVLEVMQAGYTLNGRIVRPALVAVTQ